MPFVPWTPTRRHPLAVDLAPSTAASGPRCRPATGRPSIPSTAANPGGCSGTPWRCVATRHGQPTRPRKPLWRWHCSRRFVTPAGDRLCACLAPRRHADTPRAAAGTVAGRVVPPAPSTPPTSPTAPTPSSLIPHPPRPSSSPAATTASATPKCGPCACPQARRPPAAPAANGPCQVGNEKAIQITGEVWTSPDLMLTLSSRDFDPRNGEINCRLKGLKRGEPEAAWMRVPTDCKQPARRVNRASSPTG